MRKERSVVGPGASTQTENKEPSKSTNTSEVGTIQEGGTYIPNPFASDEANELIRQGLIQDGEYD